MRHAVTLPECTQCRHDRNMTAVPLLDEPLCLFELDRSPDYTQGRREAVPLLGEPLGVFAPEYTQGRHPCVPTPDEFWTSILTSALAWGPECPFWQVSEWQVIKPYLCLMSRSVSLSSIARLKTPFVRHSGHAALASTWSRMARTVPSAFPFPTAPNAQSAQKRWPHSSPSG